MTLPFDQRVASLATEMRNDLLARFEQSALRWLALLPQWTDRLAHAVGFPLTEDLTAFVEHAQEAELCQSLRGYDSSGAAVLRFWMPSTPRKELLEEADPVAILEDARQLAEGIQRAVADGLDVAPGIVRWATLIVAASGDERAGEELTRCVAAAVDAGNIGDALEWIYAGEALVTLLGAEMSSAIARAKRTLNLRYRAVQDERYLEHFLPRGEQIAVLEGLLALDTDTWAVHFAGVGGVGKTMLVRYVTGPYASEHGLKELPTSRVDFDHLDPRYPTQRPGRLLEELADGLAAYLREEIQESLLRSFLATVAQADRAAHEVSGDPLAAVRTPEFRSTLRAFAAFVNSLPQPVLLVLDTCEELAKLHPAGETVPSVDATFEILERLHKRAPDIRVLFAGRRLLSPEMANWRLPEDVPQPPSIMSLGPRPYVVLHEVRAFRRDEAQRYFADVRKLDPDPALFEQILSRAAELGRVPALESLGDGEPDEPRFNPFDLSLYADLLNSNPRLSAADLERGIDPYVELRILDRLAGHPDVIALIPAAALLGTFDATLIAPVLGGDSEAVTQALAILAEQEWIDIRGTVIQDMLFQVEPALRPRLLDYYSHEKRRAKLKLARRLVSPALVAALEADEVEDVQPHAVEAAADELRAADAARLIDDLARRAADQGEWAWAEDVCARLLAEDREPLLKRELASAVRALYIAAIRHRDRRFDAGSLWQAVADDAAEHPIPAEGRRLSLRAALGGVVARTLRPERLERDDLHPIQAALTQADEVLGAGDSDSDVLAAAVAAIEAVIERHERTPAAPFQAYGSADARLPAAVLDKLVDLTTRSPVEVDADLHAYAESLRARHLGLRGEAHAAMRSFERAVDVARASAGGVGYADWLAPASLQARIALERSRYALALGRVARARADAPRTAVHVDGERLLSLQLRTQLAYGPVPASAVEDYDELAAESAPHVAVAPAHECVPPLFVSVAYAWLALRRPERALALLADQERSAAALGGDGTSEIAREAAVATACVLARLRIEERASLMVELAASDDPSASAVGYAGAALVKGRQPDLGSRADTRIHSTFRAATLLDAKGDDRHIVWTTEELDDSRLSSADRLHRALDQLEVALVQERIGSGGDAAQAAEAAGVARREYEDARAQSPCDPRDPLLREHLRLDWRCRALGVLPSDAPLDSGPRKRVAAEVALEEGELLGLRVPDAAKGILAEAEELFAGTRDAFGAFVAALRGAIAEIHGGRPEDARAARPRIEERAAAAFADGTKDLKHWRGWDERLEAYRAWCEGNGESPSLEKVPAELHLEAARGVRFAAGARTARQFERFISRDLPRVLAGLVAIGVAVVGTGLIDDLWLRVAVATAIFVVLYAGGRFVIPKLVATAFRRVALDVYITRPHHVEGQAIATLWVTQGGRSLLSSLVIALVQRRLPYTRTDLEVEAESFSEQLPAKLVDALPSSAGRFGVRPAIRLFVDTRSAEVPWEARLLAPLAGEPGWTPKRSPRVWRVARGSTRGGRGVAAAGDVVAVCGSEWTYFATQALASVGGELTFWDPAAQRNAPVRHASAVVLGSPELTGAGWRMRLDGVEIPADPGGGGLVPSRSRTLVSADDVFYGSQPSLLVVVGAPAGETPVADPHAAEGLRSFANAAHAAGVPAVVTIPTLPPRLAEDVLGRLVAEHRRRSHPIDVVTELREMVFRADGDPVDDAARRECARIALDVCLYGPS